MRAGPSQRSRVQLAWLLLAVVLGMSPWFSATVVVAAMTAEWGASSAAGVWLTLAVQLGFVVGSAISAALLLSDRMRPATLAAHSALVAAAATAALTLPMVHAPGAILLRFIVGVALAGVYPPAIKLAAGWTLTRRGAAIGALVGGTTLGSAVPHLLKVVGDPSLWRVLLLVAASCAAVGGVIFSTIVKEGPHHQPSTPFDPRAIGRVIQNRGVRLASLGYLGHMWELYAMWSTIGLFWAIAVDRYGLPLWVGPLVAFASVSAGVPGSVWAGYAADRMGRSNVTIIAMAVSGACSLAIGPLLRGPFLLLFFVSLVWGGAIVADSAQFSAAVTEFSDDRLVGTSVTLQTALGFLLTTVTIRLVPTWSQWWGWEYAYAPLALGPAFGIVAMLRLRGLERQHTYPR